MVGQQADEPINLHTWEGIRTYFQKLAWSLSLMIRTGRSQFFIGRCFGRLRFSHGHETTCERRACFLVSLSAARAATTGGMIIPMLSLAEHDTANLKRQSRLGALCLKDVARAHLPLIEDLLSSSDCSFTCFVEPIAPVEGDFLLDLLNAGVDYGIVESGCVVEAQVAHRIIVRFAQLTEASVATVAGQVRDLGYAGCLVELGNDCSSEALSALVKLTDAMRQSQPDVKIYARTSDNFCSGPEDHVRLISRLNSETVKFLVAVKPDSFAAVAAEILCSIAVSDRPDGLIPTVVVDELGAALGLVYSNKASIQETLRLDEGVYFSRKRGLWHKGATSGATQELIRIDLDCDRDALRFMVHQKGVGFCHLGCRNCWLHDVGLGSLERTLLQRKGNAPANSYTRRLFNDDGLLRAKIIEEAHELCDASSRDEVRWEAADVFYFSLVRAVRDDVSLRDISRHLDLRHKKISRRPGNAKPQYCAPPESNKSVMSPPDEPSCLMRVCTAKSLSKEERAKLLLRPATAFGTAFAVIPPIIEAVKRRGDEALLEYTEKFDGVRLTSPVLNLSELKEIVLPTEVRQAIDLAYDNIWNFHAAQLAKEKIMSVETCPGVRCDRFARPIERVGLYVPGGTAILPSTALMLGVPAKVAGCKQIIFACPPRKDGSVAPEVLYVAKKIGASLLVVAGGAQAIAAMAYGTKTIPKVDKICGPGNQFVTAAKMFVQNDASAMVSIDMPAGPSEVLVIADAKSDSSFVVSDLLSQAEHGPDSQVVLVGVGYTKDHLSRVMEELREQTAKLPRRSICEQSLSKSFVLLVDSMEEAMQFSNEYAPEHLILNVLNSETFLDQVTSAGSVFLGEYSPESCGDYASGTNHTLPTYGYARMYSGVSTSTFLKHITAQKLSKEGLQTIGEAVMTLARVEGLEAHRNAVAIRLGRN